jgi:glycosyltransferase involved in cell wall biosynthesis
MSVKPSISFFCPAYNDQDNIEKVVAAASKFLPEASREYEIIIVEDGSPDRTAQVVDELAKKYRNVRVIHHAKNRGYGGALKSGFSQCRNEIVIYTDGDAQFDVAELSRLLPLLGEADIVTGFRTNRVISLWRLIQSSVFNGIICALFDLEVKDVNCALKVFKKKVIDTITIESDSSFITAEIFIKARANGFTVKQAGVTHYPRLHGKASGATPRVVLGTIRDILHYYFNPPNPPARA